NDNNGLRFGESEDYNVAADWQLYLLQNMNQWYLDPNVGGWVNSGGGAQGLVLEVNVTPVPEPGTLSFLFLALAVLSAGSKRILIRAAEPRTRRRGGDKVTYRNLQPLRAGGLPVLKRASIPFGEPPNAFILGKAKRFDRGTG